MFPLEENRNRSWAILGGLLVAGSFMMRIECNIIQTCNARCTHCNKAVGYGDATTAARKKPLLPMMSVAQVAKAIDQLLEQKVRVPRFTICGGEPIMHPDLQEIIYEIDRLRTMVFCRVLTNDLPGTADKRAAIILPPRFIWIPNPLDNPDDPMSGKNDAGARGNGRTHSPFWISPADVGETAKFEDCTVKNWCGCGLDSSGWSMCGKAVMFGKLFGIDPTMREGPIEAHVNTGIPEICKHCQYGLGGKKRKPKGMPRVNIKADAIHQRYKRGELPEVSETFRNAFDRFNADGPLIQLEEL